MISINQKNCKVDRAAGSSIKISRISKFFNKIDNSFLDTIKSVEKFDIPTNIMTTAIISNIFKPFINSKKTTTTFNKVSNSLTKKPEKYKEKDDGGTLIDLEDPDKYIYKEDEMINIKHIL